MHQKFEVRKAIKAAVTNKSLALVRTEESMVGKPVKNLKRYLRRLNLETGSNISKKLRLEIGGRSRDINLAMTDYVPPAQPRDVAMTDLKIPMPESAEQVAQNTFRTKSGQTITLNLYFN